MLHVIMDVIVNTPVVLFDSESLDINGDTFRQSKGLGNPAFFSFDLGIDDKNSSVHITEVSSIHVLCEI